VDLDEMLYVGDDIEDDLDSILLSPIVSTIKKWQTFTFLSCTQLLNRLVELDDIWYGGDGTEYNHDYIYVIP
jgi:hypothetical protein